MFLSLFTLLYSVNLKAETNYSEEELAKIKDILRGNSTEEYSVIIVKEEGLTVAHILAQYNPNWSTDDKEILKLKNKDGYRVADLLKNR